VGVAQTSGLFEAAKDTSVMPQNFVECDREQAFLMPPDPRDWLLEGHLAWFVLGSVEQLDLAAFYASYRLDGWGRAAFAPQMMVPLLWYAYARGERSSRGIERGCVEDVTYRVIAAHQAPDHATIARFRVRHEQSPADLFTEVLSLCKEPGLVKVGVIAIDGTKVHANASHHCNLDYEQSRARSSSRPPRSTRPRTSCSATPAAMSCRPSFGPRASCASACARPSSAWTPSARRSRSRSRAHARNACGAKKRLEQELELERRVRADYRAWRARGISADGRRFGGREPKLEPLLEQPRGKINTTDPDSRNVKTARSYTQGYNAQAVVNEHQIVLAAEVTMPQRPLDLKVTSSGTAARWTASTGARRRGSATATRRWASTPRPSYRSTTRPRSRALEADAAAGPRL
jgi:transposase